MSDVLTIVLPLFLLIGLGYGAVAWQVFASHDIRSLGRFVLLFALPALIIRSFAQRSLSEVMDTQYLLAFTVGSLSVMLLGFTLLRVVGKQSVAHAAIGALGMCNSNSGYIGYPLAALVLGPIAGSALALNMLIENALLIPLALGLAAADAD